jgi:hypothetical protein
MNMRPPPFPSPPFYFRRFWTADLDPYLTAFSAAGQRIIPVDWAQPPAAEAAAGSHAAAAMGVAPGTLFYSFLVQVR